jgi:hypothetical protein
MKIIDQTPFQDPHSGQISLLERGKAVMAYGLQWVREVESQKQVIPALEAALDGHFTLLRNISPTGMEAIFPLILVGPPGIYALYVTPISGMLRAKGDQWGTLDSGAFRHEKPNLLARAARMGRALRIFLHQHGYPEEIAVDAALLFSDPTVHVDSVRPLVRVVMRDALPHYAHSIAQAPASLDLVTIQRIIDDLLPQPPQPDVESSRLAEQARLVEGGWLESAPAPAPVPTPVVQPVPAEPPEPCACLEDVVPASAPDQPVKAALPRRGMTARQRLLVGCLFLAWLLLLAAFLFMVFKDQLPWLQGLLP